MPRESIKRSNKNVCKAACGLHYLAADRKHATAQQRGHPLSCAWWSQIVLRAVSPSAAFAVAARSAFATTTNTCFAVGIFFQAFFQAKILLD